MTNILCKDNLHATSIPKILNMAVIHKQIDVIDPKLKAIVHGFVHRFERGNESNAIIPDIIIFTCLQFYCIVELFDSFKTYKVSVTNDGRTATKLHTNSATIYGRYIISIPTANNYYWKFKAAQCKSIANWAIGIDSSEHNFEHTYFHYDKDNNYAFEATGKKFAGHWKRHRDWYTPSTSGWTTGDAIEMILDGIEQIIFIKINGNKQSESVMRVKPGKYKLAVYMFTKHDSIDLLEFTINHSS